MTQHKLIHTGVSDSFALSLLNTEREAHPGQNVLVSPLSVSLALGVMLNRSKSEARGKTASTLGFGVGRSLRGINETYGTLRDSLAAGDIDLDIATSLVACNDARLKPNFVNKAQQYFDARIRLLDLEDPSAPILMNSFICQKTKGKIPSMLDGIDSAEIAQMILLSAVHCHGLWTSGFNPLLTQHENFTRLDGARVDCALMFKQSTFYYHGNLKYQAVRLPYGASGRFALYVFLPLADSAFGLERMILDLQEDGMKTIFKRFSSRRGRLFLPRFKADYASTLNESLSKLGLAEIFGDSKPTQSALDREDSALRVTLKHKTVMEVDERQCDGTSEEAPSGNLRLKSHIIMGDMPFLLRADRPFCFFVRDDLMETINIAGFIDDPSTGMPKQAG